MTTTPARQPESPDGQAEHSLNTRRMRRILVASFMGSAIEFYDFMLYATASAVVLPEVFFTSLSPGLATFVSFGTLAAGYVARPLGGVIFGHFGDRIGRKGVLITTMLAMGVATTVIGLLPTTGQIGTLAPVLLISLRLLQGLAVGGEWGGAMLIAIEHAPGGKRGLAASFANLGAPAGSVLAAGAVSAATLLPDREFFAWGWRIPFLASIILVIIGLLIRLKVAESPLFQRFEVQASQRRIPIIDVVTQYPKNVVVGTLAGMSQLMVSGIASVWAVSYAVAQGAEKTGVLSSKAMAAAVMFVMCVLSARLCDHVGRKPMLVAGVVAAILFAYPLLLLVQTGTAAGFTVAVMTGQGIQGLILGPLAAFLAELFPTAVRFTGSSLCFQAASALGAGFTPVVASGLVAANAGGIALLGAVWIAALAMCLLAVALATEGRRHDLATIA